MTPVKVFFLEPIDRERRWLLRYTRHAEAKCAAGGSYCNAMFELGEFDVRYTADGYIDATYRAEKPPTSDPRWPTKCDACGKPLAADDEYQLFSRQIYVRLETGERYTLDDAPPGACWDAWWVHKNDKDEPAYPTGCGHSIGPDRRTLIVRCPDGHDWMIDARASNCTRKDDGAHHCWVRHGRPEDGTLHVDKNGHSCAAGAGSIQTAKWHGFLDHGYLKLNRNDRP